MLRTTHAPDEGAGAVVGHQLGYTLQLRAGHAGYTLGLFRGPLGDLGLDILHPVNALTDEFLVFPAVFEDVPHDAPDQGHVGARAEAHIFVGMRCRAREARVTDDQRCVVLLLRLQQVKQRNRVCLGRVAADHENRTRVVDVVVGVGHRTIAPGVRNTGNCGRVTDTRLVVTVVGTPVSVELAEQVGLFVVVLRRSEPVDRIRSRLFADVEHLVADLVDRVVPAHARPLAADKFQRVLQTALAAGSFTNRGTLGTMRAEVDRAVPARLLTGPNTVLDLCHDGTTDRAVGADGFLDFGWCAGHSCLCLTNIGAGQRDGGRQTPDRKTRAAQECTTIDGLVGNLTEKRR